ncbi:amidase [Phycicoccus sp. BSK3Z-2]|uniref:Amidase n=1 Tax=Phycicoccus avicenniae TaxID=2828860 RepID=A0A941HZ54_9MICO|nr:amidase [Phycicoccus avicenniae]MBR7741876.1 amidase [Phycicoccus avicenniae]
MSISSTITESGAAIASGQLSPIDLVEQSLEATDALGSLGAFAQVDVDGAREQAARLTHELAAGHHRGPLHGIPFGIKSLIDVKGVESTSSSAVRAGRVPTEDAAVVTALRRSGAVIIGSTHSHEFAYGLTTPTTRNPHDVDRIPGGSSGGSAAALASSQVLGALGTDTGGSIRVPAALTGVVGLKPTYGLLPSAGVASLSWSLDHVGPMARTVHDTALVLAAFGDRHLRDSASATRHVVDVASDIQHGGEGLRVGVPTNFFFDRVQPGVENVARASIEALGEAGARLVPVTVPMSHLYHPTQWGLMVPEASAYHQEQLHTSADLYGSDVRGLLEAGEMFLATDYVRAQRARTLIARAWDEMFSTVDVLVAPSTPVTATLVGQEVLTWADGTSESVSDAYVRLSAPANLTGRPAVSVPAGTDAEGLPVGVQVIGRPFAERSLLRAAATIEKAALPG